MFSTFFEKKGPGLFSPRESLVSCLREKEYLVSFLREQFCNSREERTWSLKSRAKRSWSASFQWLVVSSRRRRVVEQCARGTAKLTRAPENRHNSERVDFAQTVQRSLNEKPSFHAKCRVYSTWRLVSTQKLALRQKAVTVFKQFRNSFKR